MTMNESSGVNIQKLFSGIGIWESKSSERAPNKPLLLLWMLGQVSSGKTRMHTFSEIDPELKKLLIEFGPPRKSVHTLYPFWYLKNEGMWELQNAEKLILRKGKKEPLISELKEKQVYGGFTKDVYNRLAEDSVLVATIANQLLASHFPVSLHEDILQAVGLEIDITATKQKPKRDPKFREKVIIAYERRCAVCGLDLQLNGITVGIEAAHIKWHQAGGPDIEQNGLALCVLHHKLFDRGVFTIKPDLMLLMSEKTTGSCGLKETISNYHGKKIRPPIRSDYYPSKDFIEWHYKEVFRKPEREL